MGQKVKEQRVCEETLKKLPTLRNDRHMKRGIPYYKIGRSVLYDLDDVAAYMQKHRIDPETLADRHRQTAE